MTYAKAAGICWREEELTVVVVVVVVVVVPAEIRNTGGWCIELLRPNHMPSHNKKVVKNMIKKYIHTKFASSFFFFFFFFFFCSCMGDSTPLRRRILSD
jgi:hypothetical protein